MSASEIYRQKALDLCQKAKAQSDFDLRAEYESLAFAYMCLAQDTEMNLLRSASLDSAAAHAEPEQLWLSQRSCQL